MIYKNDISNIKNEIGEKIGQKIIVKGSLGRNKPFEEEAVIKETYPNIFVVKYEEHDTNVSYRYTDILTRDLEVSVFDGEGYCPLIPPLQKWRPIKNKVTKFLIFRNFFCPFKYTIYYQNFREGWLCYQKQKKKIYTLIN